MGHKDLREWLTTLESKGELKKIKAQVDWDKELGAITNVAFQKGLSALLFENIKGYNSTKCRRLFTGGLVNNKQVALMFGLPKDTHPREIVKVCRERFANPIKPVRLSTGPVKENIINGKDVNLYDLPVPFWHPLDGGRYINTFCGIVTKDPETGVQNIGIYRGMIANERKIPMTIVPSQDIGQHFHKYCEMGKEMPIAVVYGWDQSLEFCAAAAIPRGVCEYDIMGSIREEPVELVQCENSDLEVPATAEIVVEGFVSNDPETFEWEGPFAEFTGYYGGERLKKPCIRVETITYREDPIFVGSLMAVGPGHPSEHGTIVPISLTARVLETIERSGVPGLLDAWILPASSGANLVLRIHKTYRGQPKQIALAVFGSNLPHPYLKNVMVVDEDIDIYDFNALEWAFAYRVNPMENDIIVIPGLSGTILDPSIPPEQREIKKYGGGISNRIIIDATEIWNYGRREEWGGNFYPPVAFRLSPDDKERVEKRWHEFCLE
jgi:4-hydroxy-3-polyprenylbenzoate decarboxylase